GDVRQFWRTNQADLSNTPSPSLQSLTDQQTMTMLICAAECRS
ncbi:hypothetical protein HMPREF3041_02256, partial [Escherichia coli]